MASRTSLGGDEFAAIEVGQGVGGAQGEGIFLAMRFDASGRALKFSRVEMGLPLCFLLVDRLHSFGGEFGILDFFEAFVANLCQPPFERLGFGGWDGLDQAEKLFCVRDIGHPLLAVRCRHFQTVTICDGFIPSIHQAFFITRRYVSGLLLPVRIAITSTMAKSHLPSFSFQARRTCFSSKSGIWEMACRIGSQMGVDGGRRGDERWGQLKRFRSSERYWMASRTWLGARDSLPSRSARVRATLRMRSWARAEKFSVTMACSR